MSEAVTRRSPALFYADGEVPMAGDVVARKPERVGVFGQAEDRRVGRVENPDAPCRENSMVERCVRVRWSVRGRDKRVTTLAAWGLVLRKRSEAEV